MAKDAYYHKMVSLMNQLDDLLNRQNDMDNMLEKLTPSESSALYNHRFIRNSGSDILP